MSAVKGVNFTKASASPPTEMNARQWGGKVRVQRDKYTCASLPSGSTISIARLPKGAMILPISRIVFDDLGTMVTAKVGDSGDDDRYLGATSVAAAGTAFLTAAAGMGYEMTDETDIIITTSGTFVSGSIYSEIYYTVA